MGAADDDDEVEIAPPDRSAANLLFLKVPELKSGKNRLHLDMRPPNGSTQAAELDRLLGAGRHPRRHRPGRRPVARPRRPGGQRVLPAAGHARRGGSPPRRGGRVRRVSG